MKDWYRNKVWSKEIENEFFYKLQKARKYNRAQYLKIQAIELIETNKLDLLKVAESLLKTVLEEYPENKIEQSTTLNSLGDIYRIRKEYDTAIEYYKKALDFEKIYPNVLTQAYLNFAELILKTEKYELFNYVQELILPRIDKLLFPVEKYKVFTILSIINQKKGNSVQAEKYFKIANDNAELKTSSLRYHRYLGIVKNRDNSLEKLLNKKYT
jgi:tetratricopeptide (TPR) repeat protein